MIKRVDSYKLMLAAEQNIEMKEYWLNKLSGDLVKTSFPYDYKVLYENKGQDSFTSAMKVETFRFSETLYLKAMDICKGKNIDVKLHMILVTALFVLLDRYRGTCDGSSDIMIGSPILKQENEGEFINTLLVFRDNVKDNASFKELLLQVKDTIVDANKNQNYPMERLLEQLNMPMTGNEFPLFDVVISLENLYDKDFIRDLSYNVGFSFLRTGESIEGTVEFNSLLYRQSTIKQIIRHYLHVLDQALPGINVRLSHLHLLSAEERKEVLIDFNSDSVDYPKDKPLHRLFAEQVERAPDRVAQIGTKSRHANSISPTPGAAPLGPILNVSGGYISITYGELDKRAAGWAYSLIERGVRADTIVGLMVEPSIDMMIGILGILKAGGAYMPIDPDCPRKRIRYMLEDSKTQILLTDYVLPSWLSDSLPVLLNLSEERSFNFHPSSKLEKPVQSNNLAYIIYTSGSTGNPKGVLVEHGNVVAYLHAFYKEFEIGPGDTGIQLTTYAFDVFVEGVFPVLLKGGKAIIPGYYQLMNMEVLLRLMVTHHVSIIDCTPLQLNEFNKLIPPRPGENPFGVELTIISGGDILKREYVDRFLGTGKVYNTYGPTESTVCATYYRLNHEDPQSQTFPAASIPIGRPIANYSVYLLDENLNLIPPGVMGELCISGPGITRGYLNRPELTAEKFLLNFYKSYRSYMSNKPYINKTIYKTGDLARWLSDGNIEFVGRKDHQVKIRGYRIEMGEIEQQLLKIDEIKEVVVITREDKDGDHYLCAYIVLGRELATGELREFLSGVLPDYMIPAFFVFLEKYPLTPNGKIDIQALPAPSVKGTEKYIAPRTPQEAKLGELWSEVLGIEKETVGIDDNFFKVGGHSLKAVILTSRIYKELKVNLTLADVFKTPTIRGLAGYIKEAPQNEYVSIQPVEKKEYYNLSHAQERLWVLHQIEQEQVAYNMPGSLEFGQLDRDAFDRAVKTLLERHEILRTSFIIINGEPKQKIHDYGSLNFKVDYLDIRGEENLGEIVETLKQAEKDISFNLEIAPLIRTKLLHTHHHRFLFLITLHHIVSDGWSIEVIVREATALYNAYCGGEADPLPPLRIQYKDYTQWQAHQLAGDNLKKHRDYWLNRFKGEIPLLELPTDFPRPKLKSFAGEFIYFSLSKDISQQLKQIGRENNTTLFIVFLTVVTVFLYRYTGQRDIIVGTPVSGREYKDLENQIGFYVNMVVLRNRLTDSQSFRELLQTVKLNTLEAFEHQVYPFDQLAQEVQGLRDLSHNPLFDVVVTGRTQREYVPGQDSPGLENENDSRDLLEAGSAASKHDLRLLLIDQGSQITIHIQYNPQLFKKERIIVIKERLVSLITDIITNRDEKIDNLDLMTAFDIEKEKNNLAGGGF